MKLPKPFLPIFLDDQAHVLGRYSRAARFPVIPADMTYRAYGFEFHALFKILAHRFDGLTIDIRGLLFNMIKQMMCLPAASTHHHRTAGGLFFHSFETGVIAAKLAIDEKADDHTVIATMVAGFLHDLGKSVSLFKVSKLDTWTVNRIEELEMHQVIPDVVWNPNKTILADWCADQNVKYLALEFMKRPRIGHVQEGSTLWRSIIPEHLMNILQSDAKLFEELSTYLDGRHQQGDLRRRVAKADFESINRDLNPNIRTEPKRSDLHLVRRFIEFMYLAPWNTPIAPFIYKPFRSLRMKDKPFAFFVATTTNIYSFLDYVHSEDLYGHVIPKQWWEVLQILESHGVLQREAPNGQWTPQSCTPERYKVPLIEKIDFDSRYLERTLTVPLCYCPFAEGAIPSERFGADYT